MASGFIYYVSVTGVTGARESLADMIDKNVSQIKITPVFRRCRIGISKPEHIRAMTSGDAIIVGSAIIKIIEENEGSRPGGSFEALKEATVLSRVAGKKNCTALPHSLFYLPESRYSGRQLLHTFSV